MKALLSVFSMALILLGTSSQSEATSPIRVITSDKAVLVMCPADPLEMSGCVDKIKLKVKRKTMEYAVVAYSEEVAKDLEYVMGNYRFHQKLTSLPFSVEGFEAKKIIAGRERLAFVVLKMTTPPVPRGLSRR